MASVEVSSPITYTRHKTPDAPPGILSLPIDVLNTIVFFLTEGGVSLNSKHPNNGSKIRPKFTFELNHLTPNYPSLLAFSSTCSYLRRYLGPVLFQNLSLVRENHIDAILSVPKAFEVFSYKDQYYREIIREVLYKNFEECSSAELAQTGFRMVKGSDFKSRYQRSFSMNHFVSYVECGKELIMSGNLKLFSNLTSLKVLDNFRETDADKGTETETETETKYDIKDTLPFVKQLAINVVNINTFSSIISQLSRLDVYIDFNEAVPEDLERLISSLKANTLTEVNLFLSENTALIYTPVLQVISSVCTPILQQLSIRVIRRSYTLYHTSSNSSIEDDSDAVLMSALKRSINLKHFTIDLAFLEYFNLYDGMDSVPESGWLPNKVLTIIDPSVIVPRILDSTKVKIEILVNKLGISHLNLQFGDPMSQSDISAISQLSDFVQFNFRRNNHLISTVSTEQVWSTSNESILRDLIRDSVFKYNSKDTQREERIKEKVKIDHYKPWYKSPFNTPNYKRYYEYYLKSAEDPKFISVDKPSASVSGVFWSTEASLNELEHYARKERKLSSIWD